MTLVRSLPTLLALACAHDAYAAGTNYPTRPVRMLVGFTPGGTSDVVARIISRKLTDTWASNSWSTIARVRRAYSPPNSPRAPRPMATH